MGDGFTHGARAARRAALMDDWWQALYACLAAPSDELRSAAVGAVLRADKEGAYGRWNEAMEVGEMARKWVDDLAAGHRQTWLLTLHKLVGGELRGSWQNFRRFKELSPFAGEILLFTETNAFGVSKLIGDVDQLVPVPARARDAQGKEPGEISVHAVVLSRDGHRNHLLE